MVAARRSLPSDIVDLPIASWLALHASRDFDPTRALRDVLFFGAAIPPTGGMGYPVFDVSGTEPLKLEVFSAPPRDGGPLFGAAGMKVHRHVEFAPLYYEFEPLRAMVERTLRTVRGTDRNNKSSAPSVHPSLLLIAATGQVVESTGENRSIPGGRVEHYFLVRLQRVYDARVFWVQI